MSKNHTNDMKDLINTQANNVLGTLIFELEAGDTKKTDQELLDIVLNYNSVKRDITQIEDYLSYYYGDNIANMHAFIMMLKLGIKIGAFYEIEDHKKNQYEYFK